MDTTPGGGGRVWAPWTVILPGTTAGTVTVALGTVGWWGVGLGWGPPARMTQLRQYLVCSLCLVQRLVDRWGIGQWVLVVAAVVMLVLGLRRPGSRRSAAIAAWSLIPLAIAWMAFWTVQAEHSF